MPKPKSEEAEQTQFPEYHPPTEFGDNDQSPNLTEGKYQVTAVETKNSSKFGEIVIVTLADGTKRHTTSTVMGPQLKNMKPPATINVTKPANKRYYTLA